MSSLTGRKRASTTAAARTLLFGVTVVPSLISSLPLVVLAAILVMSSAQLCSRWVLPIIGMWSDELD
jgi:hypothetical protein